MKYLYSILIKLAAVVLILGVVFKLMTNLTFDEIFLISSAVTLISYIVGDILILNITNNTVATLADLALSFLTIYAFRIFDMETLTFFSALIACLSLSIEEFFFHKYMAKYVYPDKEE